MIKLFSFISTDNIEKRINAWIQEHKDFTVTNVIYRVQVYEGDLWHFIMLVYSPPKEDYPDSSQLLSTPNLQISK